MIYESIISRARESSVSELQKTISKILKRGYESVFCENQEFDGLYRARQHNLIYGESVDYIFENEKEFWNKPSNLVDKWGRCNDIGESMFYASNSLKTVVKEIRPEVGKYITIATFKPIIENGVIPSFRIKPCCIEYLKECKNLESCIHNESNSNDGLIEVDHLINRLFTLNVKAEEAYLYKITVAITKCMLANAVDQLGISRSMHGMIYPSIINDLKAYNILLKPEYAVNNLHIESLQTLKVLETTKKSVVVKLVRNIHRFKTKNPSNTYRDIEWHPEIDGEIDTLIYNN